MKYPDAIDPDKIGTYDAIAFSGGGYFYDEVLEYRVWVRPQDEKDEIHYHYFDNYAAALAFSEKTAGAEQPLALVLQKAYIAPDKDGKLEIIEEERIAEWRVEWLEHRRGPGVLEHFIQTNPAPMK